MSRRVSRRPERLGDLIRASVHELGWEQRFAEEDLVARWREAVGPRIAAHTRADHIDNRRLVVAVDSPVWSQQLTFLKPDILRRLAARFGGGLVTDLYFVSGQIEAPRPEPAAASPSPAAPPAELPAEIAAEIAAVPDEGVREAVARAARAALSRCS